MILKLIKNLIILFSLQKANIQRHILSIEKQFVNNCINQISIKNYIYELEKLAFATCYLNLCF
jgi:hypothetical protein